MPKKSPRTKKVTSSALKTGPPPVAPKPRLLPFYAPAFSWDTFENFFCDFLAACPELIGKDGIPQRIVSTSLYGMRGDNQHGIDIRAEIANGEVWAFQCKHYKSWGPADTRDVIAKCEYTADRKFLLVTRTVSSESRDEVAKHADWQIWDSDDISREFLARLPLETAARLLYTNFGPSWPKELLNLPGLGPLYTSDAKFAPFLEEGRTFHHRIGLIGRKDWLKTLDDFIVNEQERVLIFSGRGGVGKSRILREWSQGFSRRHNGWTLRFVSDSPSDFGPAIDTCSRPLVLVFDDAHRLDDVRRPLFSELPARQHVKLVLCLRPGPIDQVEVELTDAGFDATQINHPEPLKRLSSEHALELAEAALGTELSERFRLRLRDLSRDCPLLAVLAAELLKTGKLADRDLNDIAEFRIHVFKGLLSEARPVEESFGTTLTRDILRLLALLAPVKVDADFLKIAAQFLGPATQPSHVSDIINAIEQVGLLATTGAGVRVTPDLLSDHLSFTACYDKRGNDTTFVGRVFELFPLNKFPRLIQHVAEAEWQALQVNDSAQSVIEPVWQWFLERFNQNSFHERHEQLKQWANLAHIQPRRTLELAQLSVKLQNAPSPKNTWLVGKDMNSHAHVLSALPSLLKPLAKHQSESVASCLDILWKIGRDRPATFTNEREHPISAIGDIARYDGGRFPAVQREVLAWLQRLFRSNNWHTTENKPAWVLAQLLHPFFSQSIEEQWSTGRTLHWRTIPIHLGNTAEFREGTLKICQTISATHSTPLILATLGVLEHAMRAAQLSGQDPTPEFLSEWHNERLKALAIATEIGRSNDAPAIQYRLREILRRILQFDATAFREHCRPVFESIPNTLEVRLLRVTMESYWDEFYRPAQAHTMGRRDEAKQRQEQFIRSTADALLDTYPDPSNLLNKLGQCHNDCTLVDFNPNFDIVLRSISDRYASYSLKLAEQLISEPSHPLGWTLGALIFSPTSNKLQRRLSFCVAAIETGAEGLTIGAIDCITWWRKETDLPNEAWSKISETAPKSSIQVARAIVRFVHLNENAPAQADWSLLAYIPVQPEDSYLIKQILACSANLLAKEIAPNPEFADAILAKLVNLNSLGGHEVISSLAKFAKYFPGKVLMLAWRRYKLKQMAKPELEPLPTDFGSIFFADVSADPDAAAVVAQLQARLIDGDELSYEEHQILGIPLLQSVGGPETNLLRLLSFASSPHQLRRVADFAQRRHSRILVLECVNFTRELFLKARAAGEECHTEIFQHLLSLPANRGFGGIEPNNEWKALVEAIEAKAKQYESDSELGPYFAAVLKHERAWIAGMRRSGLEHERAYQNDLD